MGKHLVLVGAGHANLHLASRAEDFIHRGFQVTLIDPGSFWYSGMATGMLGGLYEPADDQVDSQALIEVHGGDYVQAKVAQVDTRKRRLLLDDGTQLGYDFLSINVGSHAMLDVIPGAAESHSCWPVKPIVNLYTLRRHLSDRMSANRALKVVIVGGGPTGCEVTANIAGLIAGTTGSLEITLIASGERLLESFPAGAARSLHRNLTQRGVHILYRTRVAECRQGAMFTDSGEKIEADLIIPAVGLAANSLVQKTGLPCDPKSGLRVQATLHSVGDERVFAAGDCAALEGHPLPKLGVFSVRQATYIHDNLLAAMAGKPLKKYTPQKRYLAILNLGDGTGLAVRGGLWWHGRASMWLKNYIDRRFMKGYQRQYA